MRKDHELKDELLSIIATFGPETFVNIEFCANKLCTSKERLKKLLDDIATDFRCLRKHYRYGNEGYRYYRNAETETFLKSGGYTKLARQEYWRNFPKDKWYLLDPVKFIGGAIAGSLITIAIQQLTKQPEDSEGNKKVQKENTRNADKEPLQVPEKDTSKVK